jgi:hypothetical protein
MKTVKKEEEGEKKERKYILISPFSTEFSPRTTQQTKPIVKLGELAAPAAAAAAGGKDKKNNNNSSSSNRK